MHQKPVCTETGACDRGRRRTSAAQPKQRAFKEAWNRDISAGKAGDDLRKTENRYDKTASAVRGSKGEDQPDAFAACTGL